MLQGGEYTAHSVRHYLERVWTERDELWRKRDRVSLIFLTQPADLGATCSGSSALACMQYAQRRFTDRLISLLWFQMFVGLDRCQEQRPTTGKRSVVGRISFSRVSSPLTSRLVKAALSSSTVLIATLNAAAEARGPFVVTER